jgi:CheY-like chemotaxis protein
MNAIKLMSEKYFPQEFIRKKRILLIDDNADTLCLLRIVLEKNGYLVNVAAEASAVYDQNPELPDLFIIDINLGEADGREVCRYLKLNPLTRDIPVILYTGQPSGSARDTSGCFADYLLIKPFTVSALKDTIVRLLLKAITGTSPQGESLN